jgi:hypothetical protein
MANVQLFAKKQGISSPSDAPGISTDYVKLDLMSSEPIKLSLSVQDFEDPTKVASVFSQTFKLPHTPPNGQYFKAAFNVNSMDFDISKKADAYLTVDGTYFTSGNIRLTAVSVNEADSSVQYEITFFGETADFASKVGGGFLNEIDFVTLDPDAPQFSLIHAKTYDNVSKSFLREFMDGNLIYGLVEWGYEYNDDNQPSDTTVSKGFLKSFDDSGNPLWLEQVKPLIRAKIIWDKIFYDAGYTYESEFLNSLLFTDLYVISETESRSTLPVEATFKATGTMGAFNVFPIQVTGQEYLARCRTEEFDYMDAYDNATKFEYVSQNTSTHTFKIKCSYTLQKLPGGSDPTAVNNQFRIWLVNSRTGLAYFNYSGNVNLTTYTSPEYTVPLSLQAGDRITMWVSAIAPVMSGPFAVNFHSMLFSCTETGSVSQFNVASILPKTVKKIDFIKSILTKFKLTMVPSKETPNHFIIEPWKTWIRSGTTVDWTDKLDESKSITIKPLFDKQKRKMIFTEQTDTDFLNDEYQKSNDNKPYGQLILDSPIDLITGEEKVSTQFAPCPIAPIAYPEGEVNAKSFIIPHIAKDTGGTAGEGSAGNVGKREPITPKMRLLYYNGLRSTGTNNTWYIATGAGGSGPTPWGSYPMFSNYSTWPVTQESLDLNWKNEIPMWDTSVAGQTEWMTPLTAFTVYWKDWYDIVYDPYSRIVEATFILDSLDIANFEFNDLVFVKGTWYFVNEIKDYVVGEKSACKVELVKLGSDLSLNIIETQRLNSVNLCYSTVSYCDAYCCCQSPTTCPGYSTYYTSSETFTGSISLFLDPYGTVPAPPGYYSDGLAACTIGDNGMVMSFENVAVCECQEITDYSFDVSYAQAPCPTLNNTTTFTIYGRYEVFSDNDYLYLDSDLTVPVQAGWYRLLTSAVLAYQTNSSGLLIATYPLADCVTSPYFLFRPIYSGVECDSCCANDARPIYLDSEKFDDATEAWLDNTGTEEAPVGYYAYEGSIMYVNPAGVVDSYTLCEDCDPCPDGTVSVTVCVFQNLPNYKTVGRLFTSTNGVDWTTKGDVVSIGDDPFGDPVCQEFLLDANLHCKVVFGSDVPESSMGVELKADANVILTDSKATPCTYTLQFPTVLQDGVDYTATAIVLDGTAGDKDSYPLKLWFTDNLTDACVAFCHVTISSDTYYGNGLTLSTSTYLFTDALMTSPAPKGWYSDGINAFLVEGDGAITIQADTSACGCSGQQTQLYEFVAYYDDTVACDACATDADLMVYGTEPNPVNCKVFYVYGPSGLELAPAGFYSVNNRWVELDSNGVVVDDGRCDTDCVITPYYATYYIINRTLSTVSYSYTGQDSLVYAGTIAPGGYVTTVCMDRFSLTVSGYYELVEIAECAP